MRKFIKWFLFATIGYMYATDTERERIIELANYRNSLNKIK